MYRRYGGMRAVLTKIGLTVVVESRPIGQFLAAMALSGLAKRFCQRKTRYMMARRQG